MRKMNRETIRDLANRNLHYADFYKKKLDESKGEGTVMCVARSLCVVVVVVVVVVAAMCLRCFETRVFRVACRVSPTFPHNTNAQCVRSSRSRGGG